MSAKKLNSKFAHLITKDGIFKKLSINFFIFKKISIIMSNSILQYSSITKKIVMALVGLFLLVFLLVHLAVNSFLIFDPSRALFNEGAHFMATNPLIQAMQYVLFGGFILHIILGLILQIQNWMARPVRYNIEGWSHTSPFSKFMIHTGIIIFIFLGIHFINFFFVAKFGEIPVFPGTEIEDMGLLVIQVFKMPGYVAFYVIALILLAFHLHHAFQSAFQSLGMNHSKYTPFIKGLSTVLSVVISLGFIAITLIIFFSSSYQA